MICAKIDKIIAAMTASCLTPAEIAEKAGVSVNVIYRMRKGYLVKMDCFGKVCRALEIKAEDYIDYERLKQRERRSAGK